MSGLIPRHADLTVNKYLSTDANDPDYIKEKMERENDPNYKVNSNKWFRVVNELPWEKAEDRMNMRIRDIMYSNKAFDKDGIGHRPRGDILRHALGRGNSYATHGINFSTRIRQTNNTTYGDWQSVDTILSSSTTSDYDMISMWNLVGNTSTLTMSRANSEYVYMDSYGNMEWTDDSTCDKYSDEMRGWIQTYDYEKKMGKDGKIAEIEIIDKPKPKFVLEDKGKLQDLDDHYEIDAKYYCPTCGHRISKPFGKCSCGEEFKAKDLNNPVIKDEIWKYREDRFNEEYNDHMKHVMYDKEKILDILSGDGLVRKLSEWESDQLIKKVFFNPMEELENEDDELIVVSFDEMDRILGISNNLVSLISNETEII